jgi:lipopolysaccharide-induced tumor necrosis factor-alpha factor
MSAPMYPSQLQAGPYNLQQPPQQQYGAAQGYPVAMPAAGQPQYGQPQYMAGPPAGYSQQQVMPSQQMYAQGQQGSTVVIVQEQGPQYGGQGYGARTPIACVCPNCRTSVNTLVTAQPGVTAWLCCIGLGFIGAWPCMCLPFW